MDNEMKIYHFGFEKAGKDISGGERCMIENIKYFQSKKIMNIFLTTDNGKEVYEKLGLKENNFLEYKIINSYYTEQKYHLFISYILRTFKAIKLIKNIKINDNDILICHSEFFPNSIPFYILSKKHKGPKLFYWFHMLSPNIFRGYEGEFTGKFNLPNPRIIHYKLNQVLYRYLTLNRGTILTVNPYYKDILKKLYPKNKIYDIKKYSGVKIDNKKNISKKYDLVWMGRFHRQKGLLEVPYILDLLKRKKKNINLLLIGDGDIKIKKKFFEIIDRLGLKENVHYVGFVNSNERLKLLREAKLFIFTSYYESFGQVALEAMANGLPVIAYNLPIYLVFEKGMIKAPILDNQTFANEILKLLNNKDYYKNKSREALDYAKTFSWNKTGEEIYNLIYDG
jgi:glycosyltransferase involved in cell wall biosynthesis